MKLFTHLTSSSLIPFFLLISGILKSSGGNLLGKSEEVADAFEGDIEINEDEEEALENGQAQAGQIGDHYRWNNGVVPYLIDSIFTKDEKKRIFKGMEEISAKTCIRFKPRTDEKDYIQITTGLGCSSHVGRQGKGVQQVKLNRNGCFRHGTIMHEIIHAIGFWHEQSRTDRDKFVKIVFDNVENEKQHNFAKYTNKKINDYGVPYDFSSVMHYPDNAFVSNKAVLEGKKTIIPLVKGARVGQRDHLSKLDALKINRMYCPKRVQQDTLTSLKPSQTITTTRKPTTTSVTTTHKPTTTTVTTTLKPTTTTVTTTLKPTTTLETTLKPTMSIATSATPLTSRQFTRARLLAWRRRNQLDAKRFSENNGDGLDFQQQRPRFRSQISVDNSIGEDTPRENIYSNHNPISQASNRYSFNPGSDDVNDISSPQADYRYNRYYYPRQELPETRVKRMDLYVM